MYTKYTHSELAVHKLVALWHGQRPETACHPSRTNNMGFRRGCTVSQFCHFKLNIIFILNLRALCVMYALGEKQKKEQYCKNVSDLLELKNLNL